MKLIFLDFDGVLNSINYARRTRQIGEMSTTYDIDPAAAERIRRLVFETGAKIVVSSTWRIIHNLQSLQRILGVFNIPAKDVIGVTPRMNADRGHEIQAWLDCTEEDIESFVIIDDSSDMAHLLLNLVHTSWRSGFLDAHVELARDMLNNTIPSMTQNKQDNFYGMVSNTVDETEPITFENMEEARKHIEGLKSCGNSGVIQATLRAEPLDESQ